jgi:hypothetical protein
MHLDGNRRVDPVQVIQVDAAHSQPLERTLTCLFDVFGASVDNPTGIERESKLSSHKDIVPLSTAFEPVRIFKNRISIEFIDNTLVSTNQSPMRTSLSTYASEVSQKVQPLA